MNNSVEIVLALLFLILALVGFGQRFGHYIMDFRVRKESIDLIFFNFFPVWHIAYSDIAEIQSVSRRDILSMNCLPPSFISRPLGGHVIIRKNRGFVGSILITPKNRDEFVTSVLQKVSP